MRSSNIIRKKARWLWDNCLEIVFPRTCIGCGKYLQGGPYSYLCRICARQIDWIIEPSCSRCGAPLCGSYTDEARCPLCSERAPAFDQCKSLFLYRGMGAKLVHCLKYEGGIWLQPQIMELIKENSDLQAYFEDRTLVPIPLHWRKANRRGYNQAEVIARAIENACSTARMAHMLKRSKGTDSQTLLTKQQRLKNLKGAFECRKMTADYCKITLIDDVLTTGATLNAAVEALHAAGVKDISAFTLAHG